MIAEHYTRYKRNFLIEEDESRNSQEDKGEGRREALALVVVGGGGGRSGSGSGASGGRAGGGAGRGGDAAGDVAGDGGRGSSAGGRPGRGPSRRDGTTAARGGTGTDVGEQNAEVGLAIAVGHAERVVARGKAGGGEGQGPISLASGNGADGLEGARVGAGHEIDLYRADGIDPAESEGLALTNVEGGVGNGGLREANGGEAGDDSSGELHGDLCV
jgi:hypothetical protein